MTNPTFKFTDFNDLVAEYYQTLCAVSFRILGDKSAAEDVVQDLFLKLWDGRNRYSSIDSIKNYLFISVKNHSLNYLRANDRLKG